MNILFDYQAFEIQTYGGVSRMFVELASQFRQSGIGCTIGIKESDNIFLKESNLVESLKPAHYRHNRVFGQKQSFKGEYRIKESLNRLAGYSIHPNYDYSKQLLRQQKFDVFHPTYFDSYFLDYIKEKPFVLTVHDMMPELFPEYFPRDDFQIIQKRLLCPLASYIHVPSKRTKKDVIDILNINPDKVVVIPHGYACTSNNYEYTSRLVSNPYILYVGTRSLYKNFIQYVLECKKVLNDYPEVRLVFTGPNFTPEEYNLFKALGLSDKVFHILASEADLISLYQHAIAFVYPSLYEGFGIPILEAYAARCPVMLNNASCFPEVAGDAAVYFEMDNGKSDFYDKFKYLYEMSEDGRKALIEKGAKRLSLFSWEKSALLLEEVYKKCL